MSNTHKTKPLGVKVCQGHVSFTEEHNHSQGPCDLPEMTPENAGFGVHRTRCYWRPNLYEPMSFCGCPLCNGHFERKINSKRNRKRTRAKTREWARDPEAYDEEVIDQRANSWW